MSVDQYGTATTEKKPRFFISSDEDNARTIIIKVYCRFSFFSPIKRTRDKVRKALRNYLELNQDQLGLPFGTTVVVLFIKMDTPSVVYAEAILPKHWMSEAQTEKISRQFKTILEEQFLTDVVTVNVETTNGIKVIS